MRPQQPFGDVSIAGVACQDHRGDAGPECAAAERDFPQTGAILAAISDAIIAIDNEHRIRYWNDAASRRYGVSESEALGRPLSEIYIREWDSPADEAAAWSALESSGFWRGENLHVAPDGRTWRMESSVTVLRGAKGERKGLVAVMREVPLARRPQKLFANAAAGIAISDGEGRFQDCNAAYSELLGYSSEELRNLHFSSVVHPEDHAANLPMAKSLIRGEIPSFNIENRYVRKDGEIVWVHKFVSVVDDDHGRPSRIMALVTDITGRKRAEADAQFLLGLDRALAAAETAEDLGNTAVRLLREYLGLTRCCLSQFDPRQDTVTITYHWTASGSVRSPSYTLREFYPEEILSRLKAGEAVAVADVSYDARMTGFADRLRSCGIHACAQAAYICDGEAVALISATDSAARKWSQADLNLLRDVISRVWPTLERARVTEQLRRSEERLRLAAEAAGFGIRDFNAATGLSWWSDETYDMLGLARGSESNPRTLLARVHPEDRERVQQALNAALDPLGSGELDVEFRGVRANDGETRWIQKLSRTLFEGSGAARRPLRTTGILVDVTRRKKAEDALSRAVKQLDGLIENSPLAIIHLDAAFRITRWSKEAEALFGWSANEVLGHTPQQLKWVHEDDRARVEALRHGYRDGTRPRATCINRNYRKNRSVIECEWHCSAIYDANGHLEALVCQVLDITEKKLIENRLREAQKTETLAVLAGGIAHDFNNLMMGVIGNASLAREMLAEDDPVQPLIQRMATAGEQAANLTKQMLAYAGKGSVIIEPVDIADAINEIWDLLRAGTPREIAMRRDIAAGLPRIRADRSQVAQMITNLVRNATEAIELPAGVIVIRSRVENVDEAGALRMAMGDITPGQYVGLEVRDTGAGMTEETRARMFDPFFSTKFQGRGLGLAAVGGIVRAHGGAIQVSSLPGHGTSVRVFFPIAEPATQPAAEKPEPLAASCSRVGTVLVIDDELPILELASAALRRAGHHAMIAQSAFEGISLLSRHRNEIDVIVLDLSMPGMNGYEALPRLLAIQPEVEVLISSGCAESDALDRMAGGAVSGTLDKPYAMNALTARVNALLTSRRDRRRA